MCYLESFLPLSSPSDLSRRVQTQSSKLTDMTDLDETKIPQRYSGNNRSNLPPCLKVQIHFALYVQPLPERRRSHTRVRILRTLEGLKAPFTRHAESRIISVHLVSKSDCKMFNGVMKQKATTPMRWRKLKTQNRGNSQELAVFQNYRRFFPQILGRDASCDVIVTRNQTKPSSIHVRTRVELEGRVYSQSLCKTISCDCDFKRFSTKKQIKQQIF